MSENQTTAQTSSRSLRVLLLVCAGALLIIAYTLVSSIYDGQQAQAMRATQSVNSACSLPALELNGLPQVLQPQLKKNCAMMAEPEERIEPNVLKEH